MNNFKYILFSEHEEMLQTLGEIIIKEVFTPDMLYICSTEDDISESFLHCKRTYQSKPDLIILDFCMPRLGEKSINESIINDNNYWNEDTKIILMVNQIPNRTFSNKNIFFLTKPLTINSVKSILQ